MRKNQAVLITGLLVGFLDGMAAAVQYLIKTGKNPGAVFKFISSAALGPSALKGGTDMVILGIFFHLLIAMLFTIFFFLIYKKTFLSRIHFLPAGFIYGSFIWLVMNLVVVPLSRAPHITLSLSRILTGWLILVFMIGIPLAYMAGKFRDKGAV